jgi:hypothetical protein
MDDSLSAVVDGLANLTANVNAHADAARRWRERSYKRLLLSATAEADSSGNALMVFDPVSQGDVWDLCRLVVGGVQWSTTAAGSAVVYLTSGQATTTPSLTQVVDEAASLPSVAFYLAKQVSLISGENLVVYVSGGTSGQQYIASAQFALLGD